MNIQPQPQVQFGYLTQAQRDKLAVARAKSSCGFGGDANADEIRSVLREVIPEKEYQGGYMLSERADKLVEALKSRITNNVRGMLPAHKAQIYRDELKEVEQRLHEADVKIPEPVIDQMVRSYFTAAIDPEDDRY